MFLGRAYTSTSATNGQAGPPLEGTLASMMSTLRDLTSRSTGTSISRPCCSPSLSAPRSYTSTVVPVASTAVTLNCMLRSGWSFSNLIRMRSTSSTLPRSKLIHAGFWPLFDTQQSPSPVVLPSTSCAVPSPGLASELVILTRRAMFSDSTPPFFCNSSSSAIAGQAEPVASVNSTLTHWISLATCMV